MIKQIFFFIQDYKKAVGRKKVRAIYMWMSWGIIGLFFYRLERGLFLALGGAYSYIRLIFIPLLYLIQALSHLEINYHANIGPGIKVLHPSMGVVINGACVIGENLTLIGGNVIGLAHSANDKVFKIGNNVTLGANACIIGPVIIGNNINIGSLACVVNDADSDTTLVGVPAKEIKRNVSSNIK